MSEFERRLEDYVLRIGPIWNTDNTERAALIAHHERVVQERDNLQRMAEYTGLNESAQQVFEESSACIEQHAGEGLRDAFRRLVRHMNPFALDGLHDRVRDLEAALAERDARIAELEAACDGLNKALQKLAKEEP